MTLDEIYETWTVPTRHGGQLSAFMRDGGSPPRLISSGPMDRVMTDLTGFDAELEVNEKLSIVLVDTKWGGINPDIRGQMPDTMDELLNWVAVVARMHWED